MRKRQMTLLLNEYGDLEGIWERWDDSRKSSVARAYAKPLAEAARHTFMVHQAAGYSKSTDEVQMATEWDDEE